MSCGAHIYYTHHKHSLEVQKGYIQNTGTEHRLINSNKAIYKMSHNTYIGLAHQSILHTYDIRIICSYIYTYLIRLYTKGIYV